jgi:hypothetical protein
LDKVDWCLEKHGQNLGKTSGSVYVCAYVIYICVSYIYLYIYICVIYIYMCVYNREYHQRRFDGFPAIDHTLFISTGGRQVSISRPKQCCVRNRKWDLQSYRLPLNKWLLILPSRDKVCLFHLRASHVDVIYIGSKNRVTQNPPWLLELSSYPTILPIF